MPSGTRFQARSGTALLICLTLLTGGVFKLSAFAREAFIAAKFGLSSATDAYFGLQQLPLTAATFMFGSFALAFTPMYAESRRRGEVFWLHGLTFYGVMLGSLLTGAVLLAAPLLLRIFVSSAGSETFATLAILSLCFVPIVCIGIWAGMCTAGGHNLRAMSMTGLPYLLMTLVLLALCATHLLNELSLPISMAAGFGLVGAYSLFCIWSAADRKRASAASILSVWRAADFRRFLQQLAASSTENLGFAANQLLMVYFLARAGTGMISANNCAMRIGMLGYGLLAQPLAQLVQARLCAAEQKHRADLFRRWLLIVATAVLMLSLALYVSSNSIVRIVYMHGKFRGTELAKVASILPAWIAYFIVMSLNVIAARYLFTTLKGAAYVRHMLSAYAAANLLRFAVAGSVSAPWIIWCSVAAEGCALLANLRSCLAKGHILHEPTNLLAHAGAGLITGPIR
jgi:peptidoglycan biosynthesis protein MviN/MurJ (putative lipid II flippase)